MLGTGSPLPTTPTEKLHGDRKLQCQGARTIFPTDLLPLQLLKMLLRVTANLHSSLAADMLLDGLPTSAVKPQRLNKEVMLSL